ncbi:uncharacterized protein LOC116182414 [Photinus pyralis]|nr:uncharacterized protein LOC116182414 [Photinus pyralis]
MRGVTCISVIAIWIGLCTADILDNLQVCKRSSSNLNDCLKSAIESALPVLKDGLPEFGFPSLEPIKMDKWNIEPQPPLHFTKRYENIEMYNHWASQIKDVSCAIGEKDFSLKIKGYNPKIKLESDYEFVNSSFAGIDVSGKGKATYDHSGYDFDLTMRGEIVQKGGDDYLTLSSANLVMTAEKFSINFKSDNAQRDNLINTFGGLHGVIMFPLVKHDYEMMYAEAYRKLANIILDQVPYNNLFPM